jgi:integration host factor subunit alpha
VKLTFEQNLLRLSAQGRCNHGNRGEGGANGWEDGDTGGMSEAVYQKIGLSRSEPAELVEQVLGEISDTLVAGESVKLSGFGSFLVRSKGERVGRNFETGVEVPIEKRKVMLFKPSLNLQPHMNGESEEEG